MQIYRVIKVSHLPDDVVYVEKLKTFSSFTKADQFLTETKKRAEMRLGCAETHRSPEATAITYGIETFCVK